MAIETKNSWYRDLDGTAKRSLYSRFVSECIRAMLELTLAQVSAVGSDNSAPTGQRIAAQQIIMALSGQKDAIDRVLDRTEGAVPQTVEVSGIEGGIAETDQKKVVTGQELKTIFARMQQERAVAAGAKKAG